MKITTDELQFYQIKSVMESFPFDISGQYIMNNYERHVFNSTKEIPGKSKAEKITMSLRLSTIAYRFVAINIYRMGMDQFTKPCLLVQQSWLTSLSGSPPCVICQQPPLSRNGVAISSKDVPSQLIEKKSYGLGRQLFRKVSDDQSGEGGYYIKIYGIFLKAKGHA